MLVLSLIFTVFIHTQQSLDRRRSTLDDDGLFNKELPGTAPVPKRNEALQNYLDDIIAEATKSKRAC